VTTILLVIGGVIALIVVVAIAAYPRDNSF